MHLVAVSDSPCGWYDETRTPVGVVHGSQAGRLWLATVTPTGAVTLLRRIDADCPFRSSTLSATDTARGVYYMGCILYTDPSAGSSSGGATGGLRTEVVGFNCSTGEVVRRVDAAPAGYIVHGVEVDPRDGALVVTAQREGAAGGG